MVRLYRISEPTAPQHKHRHTIELVIVDTTAAPALYIVGQ